MLASRERLPFRTPGSVPHLGLAKAPIVETKFLELAMSLLDFSPLIPLGTFSILLSSPETKLDSKQVLNVLNQFSNFLVVTLEQRMLMELWCIPLCPFGLLFRELFTSSQKNDIAPIGSQLNSTSLYLYFKKLPNAILFYTGY